MIKRDQNTSRKSLGEKQNLNELQRWLKKAQRLSQHQSRLSMQTSHSPKKNQIRALELKSKLLFSINNEVEPPQQNSQRAISPHRNEHERNSLFPPIQSPNFNYLEDNKIDDNSEQETKIVDRLNFFKPIERSQNKFSQRLIQIKQIQNNQNNIQTQKSGVNIISFTQARCLIQPKFMEDKGSMCITELWPEQMKQELISVNKKLEEGQDTIISRNLRMREEDKEYTQRYKPKKMKQNVEIFLKVRDDRQNMQLSEISPQNVIDSYGLRNQTKSYKISIQKKLYQQSQQSKSQDIKYIIPQKQLNEQCLNLSNITETKRSRKSTSLSRNNVSFYKNRISDEIEVDNQIQNMSTNESKQNIQDAQNDSFCQYYNQSFIKQSYSNEQQRNKFILKFSNSGKNNTEIDEQYLLRKAIQDRHLDQKKSSYWKNYEDVSQKMQQIIQIKGDCESLLENTLGLDSYLNKVDQDFNKKIDRLGKKIEKYK
ncbi:hypothetical protein ABPG74_016911 [Tetrahymena malaccensis]